ncbi:MAG: DUF3604 domain-containing protein [Alphaproteobacteria bacterium]|nr:DUF3604 domain-containing protein [Alphaproteobacteria bacterium]
MKRMILSAVIGLTLAAGVAQAEPKDREALFGETHVHTKLSFDAYIFGNRNSPDDSYRYAKGEAIKHPSGFEMKLPQPLDFQAVTDHAVYLGMVPAMFDATSTAGSHPSAVALRTAKTASERRSAFGALLPYIGQQIEDDLLDMDIVRSAWVEVIDAAEQHNEPGRFTAFIGYEYTSSQDTFENLHRNVIFEGDAPDEPYSRLLSKNPENLWRWMDNLREQGMDSLAIPHNSNGSDGFMFANTTYDGAPIDKAYTAMRMRNEPLVEISQVKGTSETHPLLSPNDEFAGFEIMPYQIATWHDSRLDGSYVRQAYQRGLALQRGGAGNPYKFGLIGASDTHVGAGAFSENNYWSKIGMVDYTGTLRGAVALRWHQRLGAQIFRLSNMWHQAQVDTIANTGVPKENPAINHLQMQWSSWGASGLAGVWAEDNTREAIFAAMRRKETFATSGPRMRVRFFGGHYLKRDMLHDPNLVELAYEKGVPMGADLLSKGTAPTFLAWVTRDGRSAPLQRLQIIKGWIDASGETHERVYDIACAGGVKPNRDTNRCPDNNAAVDVSDCSITADTGANELKAYWRDPDFRKKQNAFYYVRGIENPTCRWSSWDALRGNSHPNPSLAKTIQERVWSSPIWLEH